MVNVQRRFTVQQSAPTPIPWFVASYSAELSPAVRKGLTGAHRLLDYTPLRKREVSDTGLEMAVRMPLKICRGLGGHPGTATSTGITFDTRPQLA